MRVNVYTSDKINEWYVKKAEELGVTRSALMSMALSEYMDQKEGMESMTNLTLFMQKLDDIGNMIESSKK